jgi:hypothetical protein
MDRIVSFLLFAALFYFIMRFGCDSRPRREGPFLRLLRRHR